MKKLCRDENNKILFGVCSGISNYFNIDPTLIRLSVVVMTLFLNSFVITYIIAVLIMPVDERKK